MHTNYRFSPGVSPENISLLKSKIHHLRRSLPDRFSCDAIIEKINAGSFRTWIRLSFSEKVLEETHQSYNEAASVKIALITIERKAHHHKHLNRQSVDINT